MGLQTFPEGYCGSYTGFALLRADIAAACGYPTARVDKNIAYYKMDLKALGLNLDHKTMFGHWSEPPEDAIIPLLLHYDNEGILDPEIAGPMAERIEEALEGIPDTDTMIPGRRPRSMAQEFASGLREAAESGRPMEFF